MKMLKAPPISGEGLGRGFFQMPGRVYVGEGYRYGFNSMEKDDEVKGSGNSYDFGARLYDPRVGRWLAVDVKESRYRSLSPYHMCANNPVIFVDIDGKALYLYYDPKNGSNDWNTFVAIIENKFNGLVTVTNSATTLKVLVDGKIDWQKCFQVSMSINEQKLEETAMSRLLEENAPGAITNDMLLAEKAKLMAELKAMPGYGKLDEIINNTPRVPTRVGFGNEGFGGGINGQYEAPFYQYLTMSNIGLMDQVEAMSAFNVLLHEVVEGYSAASGAHNRSSDFNPQVPYQQAHWNGLLEQARDLNVAFIHTTMTAVNFGSESARENGWAEIHIYEKKNNNQYTKRTISVRMINNNIATDETGRPIQKSSATETISNQQYTNEYNAAKESLNEY